ncbi:MAG TPA: PQQ-like beta-propeller repeat protein [Prolixibacteraceae bacterium]|nr:PQQ-like beta-propeller repeat protein [Prolixibacteraceae bacterium]
MYRLKFKIILLSAMAGLWVQSALFAQDQNWTHFRGTSLNAVSESANPPTQWSETNNIRWKTDLEGKGWSSPVVLDNQIWLTTASDDGKKMNGVCLDFNSGKVLFNILLFTPDSVQGKHSINTYATPTACIEKGFVYLHFGTFGTACLSTSDGKIIWKRSDMNCNHVQGPGSSPIIYKNLLILHLEGNDVQYIVALDKTTGKTVWKAERPAKVYEPLAPIGKKAYITPPIVNVKGKDLLISNGSAICQALDPETGKEVWHVIQGTDSTIAMPVYENGLVYFIPGFVNSPEGEKYTELIAVNPDGAGDIAKSNVVWKRKLPVLQLLTPLLKNGLIYMVDTQNNLLCLDAKTGDVVYTKKMKNKHYASPVYASGLVYFISGKGEATILKEGRNLEIVAENKLPGEVFATPAILRNQILIRTDKGLYCIQKK